MSPVERIVSLIAPHDCLLCGAEGQLVCDYCLELELTPVPSRCYRCYGVTKQSATCSKCKPKTKLSHVWVACEYDDISSKPIIAYKFERAKAGSLMFAKALHTVLPVLDKDTLIVPVPSSTNRIRERGYDHMRLVAKNLSHCTELNYSQPLIRLGQNHQFGSNRKTRLEQMHNVFAVVKPQLVKDKKILLVDDVLTTGATLETLASVLKNAGAKQINAVVFAQKT